MKQFVTYFMLLLLLFLIGCVQEKEADVETRVLEVEGLSAETKSEVPSKIEWPEVSEKGVDERLLFEQIDKEHIEKIAGAYQALTERILRKQEEDKAYAFSANWYLDVKESEEYHEVLQMGNKAVKPLYAILYKSPNSGLYEYICALTLDELLKKPLVDGWSNAKEFLEKLNRYIIEKKTDLSSE